MQNDLAAQLEIVAVGVGGHGASIIDSCITDPRFKNAIVHVAIGNDDNGGDTGKKQQFFDQTLTDPQDSFNMQQIFPEFAELPQTTLPVGDLRSNLFRWLHLMYPESDLRDSLLYFFNPDNRVSKASDIEPQIEALIRILNIDPTTLPRLKPFLASYTNFFQDQDHRHSVANTFLAYLYLECGESNSFFSRLREMQLLPNNFRLHYLSDYRLELCAVDILGELVVGESNIDSHQHIIVPSSYHLRKPDGGIFLPEDLNPRLKHAVKNCEMVIAVTGSIANLVPPLKIITIDNHLSSHYLVQPHATAAAGAEQVQYSEPVIEFNAPVVWVGNSFAGQNEAPLHTLVDYFAKRIPHLITLLPEGSPILNAQMVDGQNHVIDRVMFAQKAYEGQGKTAANDTALNNVIAALPEDKQKMILRVLGTELHEIGKLGVKYDTHEVMSWIWFIYRMDSHIAEHYAEIETEQRYAVLTEFLQQFTASTIHEDLEVQRAFRLQAITEMDTWIELIQEIIKQRPR